MLFTGVNTRSKLAVVSTCVEAAAALLKF